MRIRISHSIAYVYAEPARHITQILRLTPRDHDGQHVMAWRIEPNIDGRLRATFEIAWLSGWTPHESQPKPLRPGSAKVRLADALGTTERSAGDEASPKPKTE